jgi:hypothetical protein
MIKVSMNIGGSNGSYNNIPMFSEMDNAREFTNFIRKQMFNILLWSHDSYGIKSNTWIGVHIHEDIDDVNYFEWDFIIYCKNIREFNQYSGMNREEIDELKVSKNRENKIKDILNEPEGNI